MKVKDLFELFDNWNIIAVINDNDLNCVKKEKIYYFFDNNNNLLDYEIVCFGFYDGEITIRIKDVDNESDN